MDQKSSGHQLRVSDLIGFYTFEVVQDFFLQKHFHMIPYPNLKIAPENGVLKDYFPFGKVTFQGLY